MKLSDIREALVIFTSCVTILGVYLAKLNNIFFDIVLKKFKRVPGKNEIFESIIELITYIIMIVDVSIVAYGIIRLKNGIYIIPFGRKGWVQELLIAFITCYFLTSVITFLRLKNMLEAETSNNKIITISKCKNNGFWKKVCYLFDKNINKINNINKFISAIIILINIIAFIGLFNNGISKLDITDTIIISFTLLLAIGIFIILQGLSSIIVMLKKEYVYYLTSSSEVIVCYYFFEYKQYYLIIKDNVEQYILKSEIKKIEKVKKAI